MKKIYFLLAAYLSAASLNVQSQTNSDYRGVWDYVSATSFTPSELTDHIEEVISQGITLKGVLISFPWRKLQPSPPTYAPSLQSGTSLFANHTGSGNYSWDDDFDGYLDAILTANTDLYIGIMIFAGPDSPIGVADANSGCARE